MGMREFFFAAGGKLLIPSELGCGDLVLSSQNIERQGLARKIFWNKELRGWFGIEVLPVASGLTTQLVVLVNTDISILTRLRRDFLALGGENWL
jgi:hypothetical protein